MTPPLLILGASEDQLPLYREARRRGLPVIGVDQRTDRPALALADQVVRCSVRRPDAIAAELGDIELAGVVTAASDAGLLSWHELSSRYRVPYVYPLTAALASGEKSVFHELAGGHGVPSYGWARSADLAELLRLAEAMRFPLVTKPNDGSGSKGTMLVRRSSELPPALGYAQRFAASGEVIVEEFLPGRNLTIEMFMRGGRRHFWLITEKRVLPGPHFVIGGHDCPAAVPPDVRERAVELAERLCLALELVDGPVNFDLIVGDDGVLRVLEANARLAGNGFPLLARTTRGVDTVAAVVSLVLGEPFDLTPTRERSAIVHVFGSPLAVDGRLTTVAGVGRAGVMPGVEACELYAAEGDLVRPFTQSANKLGYLLVTGQDHAEATHRLASALAAVRLTAEPATPEAGSESVVEGATHAAP